MTADERKCCYATERKFKTPAQKKAEMKNDERVNLANQMPKGNIGSEQKQ